RRRGLSFGPPRHRDRRVQLPIRSAARRHGAVRPHVRAGPRRQAVRVLRRVVGGPRYPPRTKGYSLMRCCRNGNNAFFVRADLCPPCLRVLSPEEAFVPGRFRELCGPDGALITNRFVDEAPLLDGLELTVVE